MQMFLTHYRWQPLKEPALGQQNDFTTDQHRARYWIALHDDLTRSSNEATLPKNEILRRTAIAPKVGGSGTGGATCCNVLDQTKIVPSAAFERFGVKYVDELATQFRKSLLEVSALNLGHGKAARSDWHDHVGQSSGDCCYRKAVKQQIGLEPKAIQYVPHGFRWPVLFKRRDPLVHLGPKTMWPCLGSDRNFAGVEDDAPIPILLRTCQMLQRCRSPEDWMPREVQLLLRCENTRSNTAFTRFANQENRLELPHLLGKALHHRRRELARLWKNRETVAGQGRVGKDICVDPAQSR